MTTTDPVEIYDTSLRDGAQTVGVEYSQEEKLRLTEKLDDIGIDYVEGGYPLSNEKDSQYFKDVRKLRLKHTKITAFGMTRKRGSRCAEDLGMQALLRSEAQVITIVGKTWDLHVTEVLSTTKDENLEMIYDSISYLREQGRNLFYDAEHFFDGFKSNPDYAIKTLQAAERGGAETIILCDTNGGSMPDFIAQTVAFVRSQLRCGIGIHCHNDCELAVANSLAAVDSGATQVQGTINGIGERCGNADLISVMANLALKKNRFILGGRGVDRLCELSRYMYQLIDQTTRDGQPFVGLNAFAHKGGMHVHAVEKIAHSYEHICPETVGNIRRIVISELGGRANISSVVRKFGHNPSSQLIERLIELVQRNELLGYQYDQAEASFALLILKEAGKFQPHFQRVYSFERVETKEGIQPFTEAILRLKVNGTEEHVVGDGDGPVNALDKALRRALTHHFPAIESMRLTDYRVSVVTHREGTQAPVRVIITSNDTQESWSTVGVSENIVEASWQALVDSFEFKLCKDAGAFSTTG